MRRIEVLEGLFLKFPGRDAEFATGVEVGALTALMGSGEPTIRRQLSAEGVEQLRPLAEHFRYRLVSTPAATDGLMDVELSQRATVRPRLRVV